MSAGMGKHALQPFSPQGRARPGQVEHVFSSYPSILTAPAFTAVSSLKECGRGTIQFASVDYLSVESAIGWQFVRASMKELLHRVSRFDSVPGYGGSSTIEHAKND